jgi:D-alanyl-D-alanine carboxypeptidase
MRFFSRSALASAIFLTICTGATAQGPKPTSPKSHHQAGFRENVEKYVQKLVKTYRIPGATVLVQRNGRVLADFSFGNCNVEFRVPASDRCVFHLASSSKLFAGTAIMQLAQRGQLRLDDPISRYLEDLPPKWRGATIRQVMNHTSGIPNFFDAPDYLKLSPEERWKLTPQQLIGMASSRPMDAQPGEKWAYAQVGPMLAGLIVERISGKPFSQYMRDTFFQPLGMAQTAYGDSSVPIEGRSAMGYRWINGALRNHQYPYDPPMYPAGGLNSSAHDIARFFAALGSGRLLSESSKAEMWERAKLKSGETRGYGLGWDVQGQDGVKVVQHSGAGSVWLGFVPKENLTIILLTNLNGVSDEFERSLKPDNPVFGILDLYREPQK